MSGTCAVILAAGDGKRMKSEKPKVMCEVLFKPMISWVCDAVLGAGIENCCVVISENAESVASVLPGGFGTAVQREKLGTGHAASMAAGYIRSGGFDDVLVMYGDAPFFTSEDIKNGLAAHLEKQDGVTLYSAALENPFGYGRVIYGGGSVSAVVEERDADVEQKKIKDINAGVYWFKADFLLDFFDNMTRSNAQGEYYLTDCAEYAAKTGRGAGMFTVEAAHIAAANDRAALSALNTQARGEIIGRHLRNGVDIPFPDGIIIGADVEIGQDTRVMPGTILKGKTIIGNGCEIGPDSHITDSVIGDGCAVLCSHVDRSVIRENARLGPWCNVRPGCEIGAGVKLGDFVEIKQSNIGEKTSVAHLTYIGDSDVGKGCNFGCGVVTANYDGKNKHRTVVGDNCFIGCNCNLVPPVTVGNGVYAATGTTITADVPAGSLVIGRAQQQVKEGWTKKRGLYDKK